MLLMGLPTRKIFFWYDKTKILKDLFLRHRTQTRMPQSQVTTHSPSSLDTQLLQPVNQNKCLMIDEFQVKSGSSGKIPASNTSRNKNRENYGRKNILNHVQSHSE